MPTPPSLPPARPPAAAKRRWRRFLIALSVFLVVALAVVLLLPVWACSDQGRQYALQQMNRKINGTLKIRSWSLGWFSPIRMDEIELDSADGTPLIQCQHLQSDFTLFSWFRGNYDLGNTLLSGLRLQNTRYSPGDTDFGRLNPPSTSSDVSKIIGSLRGSIRIEDGQLELRAAGEKDPIQIIHVIAEIPIASPTTSIHLTLTGQSVAGGKSAPIEITGDFPALTDADQEPAAFLRQLTIHAGALPVPALAAWLGLDTFAKTGWQEALGPALDTLNFESKPEGATRALCTLQLHGAAADARARAHMDWSTGHTTLLLHNEEGDLARASARLAAPTLKLLAYLNPIFADALPGKGAVDCQVQEVNWILGRPSDSQAQALITLRDVELRRAGLLGQIEEFNRPEMSTANLPPALPAAVPTMRVLVAKSRVSATPVVIDVPDHPRLLFTGSVGLDGTVDLLMTLPLPESAALSAGTARINMQGTVAHPQMQWTHP